MNVCKCVEHDVTFLDYNCKLCRRASTSSSKGWLTARARPTNNASDVG